MRLRFLVGLAAVLAVSGCASPPEESPDYEIVGGASADVTDAPDDEKKGSAPSTPAKANPAETSSEAPPATAPAAPPAAPAREDYEGKLAATSPLRFGEGCSYTVSMTDVVASVAIEGGKVTTANVASAMVERVIGTCSSPSIPRNAHEFALSSPVDVSALADGAAAVLPMKATREGAPRTSLTARLRKRGADYQVELSWKRIDDVSAPHRWTVTAPAITLEAKL